MKKLLLLVCAFCLCLTLGLCLASCGGNSGETGTETSTDAAASVEATDAPTAAPTEAPTEEATEAPTEASEATDADTEADTAEGAETSEGGYNPADYPSDQFVVITSAADLMAFNKACNEDFEDYSDMTIVLLADIDLEGYEWTPLDGNCFFDTTFDGKGHTISHMTINYNTERDITGMDEYLGCGFIGTVPAGVDIYFRNITFDNCFITARERHVGCLVGRSMGGTVEFENVTVSNFTVDGWCDYNNSKEETDGYPICFRVAGVMGASWGGMHTFTNVKVQNIKISGFHNLAGILGYDASGQVDEWSFENCSVDNAEMIFSYCLGASYTVDMPRKFVSVFYNGPQWVDNIDAVAENGNTYSGISFLDWTDDMHEYTPVDFRSWTAEEQAAG